MLKPSLVRRTYNYFADPRPDLLPALKLTLDPKFKLPIYKIGKYLANLLANRIPGIKQVVGQRREVDFSEYMKAYDRTTATLVPYQKMLSRMVELMDLKGREAVVDLGAGTGNLSILAGKQGGRVISIDCSPEANVIHRQKNPSAMILPVNIDRSPEEQREKFIPLGDAGANRFCAANLWTYIRYREPLYREIKRILKPAGVFVLAVEKKGYSPIEIIAAHLQAEYQRYLGQDFLPLTAAIRTYMEFISKYDDLVIAAQETTKLMRGIAAGEYAVFTENEIVREVEGHGFKVLSCETVYAGQAILLKLMPKN